MNYFNLLQRFKQEPNSYNRDDINTIKEIIESLAEKNNISNINMEKLKEECDSFLQFLIEIENSNTVPLAYFSRKKCLLELFDK